MFAQGFVTTAAHRGVPPGQALPACPYKPGRLQRKCRACRNVKGAVGANPRVCPGFCDHRSSPQRTPTGQALPACPYKPGRLQRKCRACRNVKGTVGANPRVCPGFCDHRSSPQRTPTGQALPACPYKPWRLQGKCRACRNVKGTVGANPCVCPGFLAAAYPEELFQNLEGILSSLVLSLEELKRDTNSALMYSGSPNVQEKGNHVPFGLPPQDVEQSLQQSGFPLLASCKESLAHGEVFLQVVVPVPEEVVQFLLSSDEQVGVANQRAASVFLGPPQPTAAVWTCVTKKKARVSPGNLEVVFFNGSRSTRRP